ncbi:MAG: class B sortase [Firmicutes bacterium]|nr:class B sortase [Bacillota bacterium]
MNKLIQTIRIILILFFIGLIIFSLTKIIPWFIDNKKTNDQIKSIEEKIKNKPETNSEIVIYDNNSKYINEKFLSLDFTKLLEENDKTVGWVKIPGTNINYPFVQTNDNNYYLYHSFNNEYNQAGWLFLDYRNNMENDQNSIIYAHGRVDGSMFGSLKNTLTKNWQDTKKHIVKVSTPANNYIYEVFSIYRIKTTDDYLQINFNDEQNYNNFLINITNRSVYNFNTNVSTTDKIITLSTCYNETDKMVLHAKLIKKEIRK